MNPATLAQALLDRAPFVTARRSDGLLLTDYFDGHRVLGEPWLLRAIAESLYGLILQSEATMVAGEVAAGGQLATAVALASVAGPRLLETRSVRRSAKPYGLAGRLTSAAPHGTAFAVVDDVAGTGAAIARVIEVLCEEGHEIAGAYVVLDREQGAAEAIAQYACTLRSLFRLSDLAALRAATPMAEQTAYTGTST